MTVDTFNKRRVDELIIVDIGASKYENPEVNTFVLKILSRNCLMPVAYGGGISTLEDINCCLNEGCDKVVINSYILKNPDFLRDAIHCFGSQCIIVSVDYRMDNKGNPVIFSHSGFDDCKFGFFEYIDFINECQAGEIILTNVDKEGWMNGLDLEIIPWAREKLDIPILLHGGAGSPEHIYDGIQSGASAVCAGSIFAFSQYGYRDIKEFLKRKNIPVRLDTESFF